MGQKNISGNTGNALNSLLFDYFSYNKYNSIIKQMKLQTLFWQIFSFITVLVEG